MPTIVVDKADTMSLKMGFYLKGYVVVYADTQISNFVIEDLCENRKVLET